MRLSLRKEVRARAGPEDERGARAQAQLGVEVDAELGCAVRLVASVALGGIDEKARVVLEELEAPEPSERRGADLPSRVLAGVVEGHERAARRAPHSAIVGSVKADAALLDVAVSEHARQLERGRVERDACGERAVRLVVEEAELPHERATVDAPSRAEAVVVERLDRDEVASVAVARGEGHDAAVTVGRPGGVGGAEAARLLGDPEVVAG